MWRIKNWTEHFENNRTRELKNMTFVPIPNKLDGDGYTELIDHPAGISHYGAWITLVHVASRCDPRGTLVRAGGIAHDARSLSRITRVSWEVLSEAIARLIEIGWLESINETSQGLAATPQEAAEIPQEAAVLVRPCCPSHVRAHAGAGASLPFPSVLGIGESEGKNQPTLQSVLNPPHNCQRSIDVFRLWFSYLATKGHEVIDPVARAASLQMLFPTVEELEQSVHYVIGSDQVWHLKNYAAEGKGRRFIQTSAEPAGDAAPIVSADTSHSKVKYFPPRRKPNASATSAPDRPGADRPAGSGTPGLNPAATQP